MIPILYLSLKISNLKGVDSGKVVNGGRGSPNEGDKEKAVVMERRRRSNTREERKRKVSVRGV